MIRTPLVRLGADHKLMKREGGHHSANVHREMLLQVCQDYAGLPDYRTLSASEIRFFYEGLRAQLKEATRPRGSR